MKQFLPWKYGNVLVVGIGSAAREIISYLIYDDSTQYPLFFIGDSEEEIEGVPFCNVSLLSDDIQRDGNITFRYETNIREILTAIFISDNCIDRVLIVSGFGGQTGTSLSPIVANIARELGKFCYVLTTTPFKFEGKTTQNTALEGIKNLYQNVSGFYCLNLASVGKEYMSSFGVTNVWMKDLINCIAHDNTRYIKANKVTNKHICVPYVVEINNADDWLESIKVITSESFVSISGIDLHVVPVLNVFFVLGNTQISLQSANEIMDRLQQWCKTDRTLMESNFIFNDNKGTSKLILMAERVELNHFLESVQALYVTNA